jgi:hypothetical protein
MDSKEIALRMVIEPLRQILQVLPDKGTTSFEVPIA